MNKVFDFIKLWWGKFKKLAVKKNFFPIFSFVAFFLAFYIEHSFIGLIGLITTGIIFILNKVNETPKAE